VFIENETWARERNGQLGQLPYCGIGRANYVLCPTNISQLYVSQRSIFLNIFQYNLTVKISLTNYTICVNAGQTFGKLISGKSLKRLPPDVIFQS